MKIITGVIEMVGHSVFGGILPPLPPLFLVIWIAFFFLVSRIFMWLWNITIPRIFNIREITYWEAFRLLIIAGLLFGKFGFNMQL